MMSIKLLIQFTIFDEEPCQIEEEPCKCPSEEESIHFEEVFFRAYRHVNTKAVEETITCGGVGIFLFELDAQSSSNDCK